MISVSHGAYIQRTTYIPSIGRNISVDRRILFSLFFRKVEPSDRLIECQAESHRRECSETKSVPQEVNEWQRPCEIRRQQCYVGPPPAFINAPVVSSEDAKI